ncbi:MAG: hypothetical protein H8E42_11405 [Nitrospinae bacterium]|nr:hypothetical protein [Nitrospinota bacterium]MBL7020387.1 hypothetical protein [Nitrospinaceae bacterium]
MNAPKTLPYQVDPGQRPHETPDDEISLLDILYLLAKNKNIILSITVVITLLAMGYVLSVPPVYRSTIGFLMPTEIPLPKSIATKDANEIQNIIEETKTSLYQKFLMQIQSYYFQQEVFDRGNFLEKFVDNPNGSVKSAVVVLGMNEAITLTGIPAKNTDTPALNTKVFDNPAFLEMEGSKPEAMAEYLNALVKAGIEKIHIDDHLFNAIDQRLKTISAKKEFLLSQEKNKHRKEIELEKNILDKKIELKMNKREKEITLKKKLR